MKKLVCLITILCFICTCVNPSGVIFASGVNSTPAISVYVPENASTPYVKTPLNETFDESSNVFFDSNYNSVPISKKEESGNYVLEYSLKGSNTIGVYGQHIQSTEFTYPAAGVSYKVSFDFKKTYDGNDGDHLWIQSYSSDQLTSVRMSMSQFEKDEWYTVEYVTSGNGTSTTTSSCVCTKTRKSTGETTSLSCDVRTGWASRWVGRIGITTWNNSGSKYTVNTETNTTPWSNVSFLLDNLSLSYEALDAIETQLVCDTSSQTVVPMLCAYDENDVMTSILYNEKEITVSGDSKFCNAEFDIMNALTEFVNAKSVRAMYWESFSSAKSCAPFVEIGDEISTKSVVSSDEIKTIAIDDYMIPDDVTCDYTVFAYTVPFTATSDNIPEFDASNHTLLGAWQDSKKITSVAYKASLYDGNKQDIVIIAGGRDGETPVVTLIEENNAPQFTNVSMLLGSDSSERNFTWFSLSSEEGKITYEKVGNMIDGEFSTNANIVAATREHDSSVYSKKEYYYQNKAVMTDLDPDTEYCYQLSNGDAKHKKVYFTTADNDSSFSFAFGGDAQVGGNDDADYVQETLNWGRSLKQITTAPEFDGIEFFVSGGDQIESATTNELIEAQYDIYLNHDEFSKLPQAVVLGNHDNKPAGYHFHHFNQPNMDVNYGATYRSDELNSADYYFVYNSALFIVLNTNDFDDLSNGKEASRADDKANADKHGEFIAKVLEETKDNKDILWKIVLYHQSPYGSSYHGNYTLNSNGVFSRSEQYDYINMREYLVPYLYEAGVDLVLSGHDHCYTRTHIIKPAKDADGNYTQFSEITPYANTDGANYYTYQDGTTTPTFVSWTDRSGNVYDGSENEYLKVKYQPSKVTDPDGILYVTGGSSSGSHINNVEYPNHYAAVTLRPMTRHMSRIDITPNSLTLKTYNLGSNSTNNIEEVDSFVIEKTANISVEGVELEESLTLPVDQSKDMKAKLSPAEPTNSNVSWNSSNPDVAQVDQNGRITAISPGQADITVTTEDGAHTDVCAVTVIEAVKVTQITLPQGIKMNVDDIKTLVSTVYPENATTKTLSWSVDKPELANINQNGSITAIGHGTVTVTATATDGSGISASTQVEISYIPSVVSLDCTKLNMNITDEKVLTASVSPANASYKEIKWSSSDDSVATVDENGKINALSVGIVTITASTKDSSASCTLSVRSSGTFFQNFEDENNQILWDTGVWSRVQDTDEDYVLKFDGSKLDSSSKIGTRYTAQIKAGTNTVMIPPASLGYAMEFEITRLSTGGHSSLYINTYSYDASCESFRLNMDNFEIGCPYDVKIVFKGSERVGYYKKAKDKFWIEDDGTVWGDGYNITGNIHYNHISMYPYNTITDLATAQSTLFVMDDISISTIDESGIAVINRGTGLNAELDITTGADNSGARVYVAAYNDGVMEYVISQPCNQDGSATVSFIQTGNEEYFKVFVLKDDIIPLKRSLWCE